MAAEAGCAASAEGVRLAVMILRMWRGRAGSVNLSGGRLRPLLPEAIAHFAANVAPA
ncbi:hypothetical protein AwMethylo_42460 [Methylobacterium sp.]|nr:hypothetical protein AwMethylo_42460 [Methylobacterium sp.]